MIPSIDSRSASRHVKEADLPIEEPPSLKACGEYDFTIRDPDGYFLEFDSLEHQQAAH